MNGDKLIRAAMSAVVVAVAAAYAASVAVGAPLSQRAMAARFGISRRQVSQLITWPGDRMPTGAGVAA